MSDPLPTLYPASQIDVRLPPAATAPVATGRPAHEPTRELRKLVKRYSLLILTQTQIAELLEISVDTLVKYYSKELQAGRTADSRVAAKLYEKALQGDTTAAIFWLKARQHWRDRDAAQILNAPVTVSADSKAVEAALLNALEGRKPAKRDAITIDQ